MSLAICLKLQRTSVARLLRCTQQEVNIWKGTATGLGKNEMKDGGSCTENDYISEMHIQCIKSTELLRVFVGRGCHSTTYSKNGGLGIQKKTFDRKNVTVVWKDDKVSRYHSLWLRFNCQCPQCLDVVTNSWKIDVEDVPLDMTIKGCQIRDNDRIEVTWNEDTHKGYLTTAFLREHCYSAETRKNAEDMKKIRFYTDMEIPTLGWSEVERSEEKEYRWVNALHEKGLCILTGVPTEDNYVLKVMQKIGYPLETAYGQIYHVKEMKNPTNVAYTSNPLNFHMDLQYYEASPGIQFLHCLRFDQSVVGGETLFVDIFHVVDIFRKNYPKEFRTLCTVPFTFRRYHDGRENPVRLLHRRPMIRVNNRDQVIQVSWNTHGTGPPVVDEENVEDFYRAYQLFARMIQDFPYTRSVRLQKGEIISFNNKRMAHGRNAFSTSTDGIRYFQGGYINISDFKSKLLVLMQKHGGKSDVQSLGDGDWE